MVDEYEAFHRRFRGSLKERLQGGALDLGEARLWAIWLSSAVHPGDDTIAHA